MSAARCSGNGLQRRRVVGYVRVSTEEQARDGVSLAAQRAKLEQYAALFELELVELIEDAGASAKTLDRPGLQRALELLRSGAAGGLLVAAAGASTPGPSSVSWPADGTPARG